MEPIDVFKQERNDFMKWFAIYAIVSFLAVCVLFGIYIKGSFGTTASITQELTGDLNRQELTNVR